MQKVRFWDPAHWRFRAEETRTVADQMTHDEADPQTKIRLTYTTRAALRQLRQVGKAGAPYVRFAGVPDIDYFCDDCNAEMLSAEYKKP